MSVLRGWRVRLRLLLGKEAADRELDEEIRLHLELETEKNIRSGLAPDEARRRAVLAFGGVEATREDHREARGASAIEDLIADVRYALRLLRRSPVLAGSAVLTLALGIGANTAIFSAVSAVILRPLPFPSADRLMAMWETNPERGWVQAQVAPANLLDWGEQVSAFEGVTAQVDFVTTTTLTGRGEPRMLRSAQVMGNYFAVLGVGPALGRTFRSGETWDSGSRVAVISDRLWRQEFGADPGVAGQMVQLDGRSVEIVGVMPPGFHFPAEDVEVWFPMAWDPAARSQVFFRRAHWVRAIARLRPGVSRAEADAQLQVVVRRIQREYPETNRVMGAGMGSLHGFLVGDTRRPLEVLLGAVGLLLLIACANVGNLLLVRARGREREAALRLALGAGRGRLVKQAMTESLVVAALGGLAGLALGHLGTLVLGTLQPPGLLPVSEVRVSWPVLWYVLAITTVSALLFGTAPALWSGRRVPAEVLKEGGRSGSTGRRARRWGDALAVGAGLLVRSFWRLQQVDPGIDPRGVLAVELRLPGAQYGTGDQMAAFFGELARQARSLPGVQSAAAVSSLPLTQTSWSSDFTAEGWAADRYGVEVVHREVTPGYFDVMRVPLMQGRVFTDADRGGAPLVVVINEALARRYFPGEDPIGRRVAFDRVPDSSSVWRTIVGVVGNEHQSGLDTEARLEFYAPYFQDTRLRMFLAVRAEGDPAALGPAVRTLVAGLDPNLAIAGMRTMEQVRGESLAPQRFLTTLLSVFALVGVILAIIGVYGVMAQSARGRTQEMGVRIALGAQARQVQWMVVRHGLVLVTVGLAIGIAGAWTGTGAMRALLYGVGPADPLTFLAVPGLLVLTAVAAAWLPALRAGRANPVAALRVE